MLFWSKLWEIYVFKSSKHLVHSFQGFLVLHTAIGSLIGEHGSLLLLQKKQLLFLSFLLLRSPFHKPFWVTLYLIKRNILRHTAHISIIFSLFKLLFIGLLIQSMHFPHFLNFIKVHNKAPFVCMILFDTLPAKHSQMVGAVEMLNPLVMFVTQQTLYTIFVFKIDVP